ncbi:MAG: hypothetical protein A3F09_05745 [Chlamydiae bacterium RIFCSPHIGHO2_12_FULL_49_11]|nr:MAG: hypothetical protein A3F09_05745 [Chlamydiae bacterium RIFCSPHIGHO2_12_FULL_49_11]
MKKKVAVFFGGRSPEHDVSIVTALQVMSALDPLLYEVIPVYVAQNHVWITGDPLFRREFYIPKRIDGKGLSALTLDLSSCTRPRLMGLNRRCHIEFDVAIPAFHGIHVEDGSVAGVLEMACIPYTGMRTSPSSVFMDKALTKAILWGTGISLLPHVEIRRPSQGRLILPEELRPITGDFSFPGCVKPSHLGSSIGVAKVDNLEELSFVLPEIFRYDTVALLEPFVPNLVEYNVAVRRIGGKAITSAIEKPKSTEVLLDFREKYLKGGMKSPGDAGQGMLSLTRELNPPLGNLEHAIRSTALKAYLQVDGSGAPRIDFLCNGHTGEIWLNEINPCPGSFGYYLWEASSRPLLFAELLDALIEEAFERNTLFSLLDDPVPDGARLFTR